MHLLRCLSFLSAKFQFYLYTSYLPGIENSLADYLSRNDASVFFLSHPGKSLSNSHPRGNTRHRNHIQTRLDVTSLDQIVDQYFLQGLAPATQSAYQSAKNRYINFCRTFQLLAIPATEQQLCRFSVFLAESNLMHKSIKCYLAAVRHLHTTVGAVDPHISSMPCLQLVLKGIKHQQAKEQHKEQPWLPITPTILRKIKDVWLSNPSLDNIMLWAAASLCFFGFLRARETTVPSETAFDQGAHLTLSDVTMDSFKSPKMLKIKIKTSKTDPFRNGIDIYVGTTNSDLCPVTAVLTYIVKQPPGNSPLFKFITGRPLTRSFVVSLPRYSTRSKNDSIDYNYTQLNTWYKSLYLYTRRNPKLHVYKI